MFMKETVVNNQVGLHARPATFFIQKANEFKSSIWVEKDERRVNAKSLLGVLSLGIVKGTSITLIGDGPDLAALEQQIRECEEAQGACGSDYVKLQELQAKQAELEAALEEKTERWMYLTELKEKIDAQ